MTRSPSRLLLAAWVALALLAGACSGGDDPSAATAPTSETSSVPESASEDGEDGASDREVATTDADLDLPRSVVYAGVELELDQAVWSNASPATYLAPEPSVGGDVMLFVELTTGFVAGYPGDDGFMPVRHFAIETADGEVRGASGVDFLAEVPIAATADSTVILAFEITEDELEGAIFTYDDGNRVAARLPLTGPVGESPYPIRTQVDEVAVPHLPTGCEPTPTEVQLVAVEWDIDGGVGEDGAKLARGQSSRAQRDHRWLRAELEVTAGTGQCGGTFANQETFRLIVDGTTKAPINTYSLTLSDGEVAPMTFLFEVPVDATEVVLDAGARNSTTATFPIAVPDLP